MNLEADICLNIWKYDELQTLNWYIQKSGLKLNPKLPSFKLNMYFILNYLYYMYYLIFSPFLNYYITNKSAIDFSDAKAYCLCCYIIMFIVALEANKPIKKSF